MSTDTSNKERLGDVKAPQEDEIEAFVVIHDQEILLSCEREGRFEGLRSYRYLFVGNRDVSRLKGLDNVVIARELADNIELYPNLLSFTGWYAVARNNLARTPWVTLLEYDVRLQREFTEKNLSLLSRGPCVIGYVPFPFTHPQYFHATPWFVPALRIAHGLDVPQLIRGHLEAGRKDQWTATTNASLPRTELETFVEWFQPVSRIFRHDPIGAHVHERTLPVFCMLRGLENVLLRDVLVHEQARSHNIRVRQIKEAQAEEDRLGWLSDSGEKAPHAL